MRKICIFLMVLFVVLYRTQVDEEARIQNRFFSVGKIK
jgi:hypothetical protein